MDRFLRLYYISLLVSLTVGGLSVFTTSILPTIIVSNLECTATCYVKLYTLWLNTCFMLFATFMYCWKTRTLKGKRLNHRWIAVLGNIFIILVIGGGQLLFLTRTFESDLEKEIFLDLGNSGIFLQTQLLVALSHFVKEDNYLDKKEENEIV